MVFDVWACNMSSNFDCAVSTVGDFRRLQKVLVYTHFDVLAFVTG